MGLFSSFRKNKQQTDLGQGAYRSKADTGFDPGAEVEAPRGRSRKAKTSGASGNQANEAADPVLPEKKRARRRLVGAVALVLAVVIVLPMILDSEPKPLVEDIAIQIPSRDSKASGAPVSASASVNNVNSLDQKEEIVDPTSIAAASPSRSAPVPLAIGATTGARVTSDAVAAIPSAAKIVSPTEFTPKPETKPKAEVKPKLIPKVDPKAMREPVSAADKHSDSARAQAILEGRIEPASSNGEKKSEKIVLQVAALASQDKANELQGRLKEAGIHSYTQKASAQTGDRIRVRVGPFNSKEEAERVRAKLTKLGLSGSLVPG